MSAPSRTATIFGLAGPIVAFFIIQNALGFAGLAMAGALSTAALAGVGTAAAIYAALTATLFGLDSAVQAVVARRTGEGDADGATMIGRAAFVVSGFAGAALMVGALIFGPPLLRAILGDGPAAEAGAAYLHGIGASLSFLGMTIVFNAYWNGTGRPRIGLIATIIDLTVSLTAASVLTFGPPALGPFGIGAGIACGALAGLLAHSALALRYLPRSALRLRRPEHQDIALVLRLGLPVSVQQCLLYVGVMVLIAILAPLGTDAVAAANMIGALLLLSILPATGFGIAAGTLAGMALGRHDASDARRWGWQVAMLGTAVIAPLSLALTLDPSWLLHLLDADGGAVAQAELPTRLIAAAFCIDAFGRILAFALRGAGDTTRPAAIAFAAQWALQLPLTWLVAVSLGHGLIGMAIVRVAVTCVETAAYVWLWRRGDWAGALAGAAIRPQRVAPGPA